MICLINKFDLFGIVNYKLIMDTKKCHCQKCKGKIVSRKTFYRHLLKENNTHEFYIESKRKVVMKSKNTEFDTVYSNQFSFEIEPTNDINATSSYQKPKKMSVPIINENDTLGFSETEF